MLNCSDSLEIAVKGLKDSLSTLKNSADRMNGWQTLNDAWYEC